MMKRILCSFGLFCLAVQGMAQSGNAEMTSSSYAIRNSAIVGAGGVAGSQSFVLQHRFSSPNMGRMEGGSFKIGTAVEIFADEEKSSLPSEFTLSQNYPNPFNQSTTFYYSVPERRNISISVYSVLGQQIAILFQGEQDVGRYRLIYAGHDGFNRPLPSGLYFCRMLTKGFDKTIKFAILR